MSDEEPLVAVAMIARVCDRPLSALCSWPLEVGCQRHGGGSAQWRHVLGTGCEARRWLGTVHAAGGAVVLGVISSMRSISSGSSSGMPGSAAYRL